MALRFPAPPLNWTQAYQLRVNQAAEVADGGSLKKGQDIEVFPPQRLILHSPNGTAWPVTVTDAGQIEPDLGVNTALVTNLPTPGAGNFGQVCCVTDGAASLAWGATIVGGGATKYLVWSNATAWTVIGK
jgi:hypothetical protein